MTEILNWIFTRLTIRDWNCTSMDVIDKKCNPKDLMIHECHCTLISQTSTTAKNFQLEIKSDLLLIMRTRVAWCGRISCFHYISERRNIGFHCFFFALSLPSFAPSFLIFLHACKNNWKSSSVKLFLVLPLLFFVCSRAIEI